ncbi:MAG: exopolysaccharide biosynthesis polyprenyl glycosylphosphotransferase, partial [Promethearchaeota archaeon]
IFNNDLLLLELKNNSNYKINSIIKTIIDYVISIILLPVLTIIFIIIAVLIKIESKGPVFYKQNRYSLSGKKITVYKFRSMYVDADKKLKELLNKNKELKKEWELNYKLKNDPRVTKIGKILRKTSLDELPQIINVIKGEMSLVGPRPIIHEELEKYYIDYKEYFINTKAGITGLWQVSGRSDTSYEYRIRTDLWYVLNWSIWLDLVIIFKTIITIIKGKGAY